LDVALAVNELEPLRGIRTPGTAERIVSEQYITCHGIHHHINANCKYSHLTVLINKQTKKWQLALHYHLRQPVSPVILGFNR